VERMSDSAPNRPKILRGAFVELGLSLPPPIVVFQFNPVQLTRSRTVSVQVPGAGRGQSARRVHSRPEFADLLELARQQFVEVGEETIGFDLRLDATDQLDDRDGLAERFGIAPQLATLEQMVLPKDDSQLATLFGRISGFSFTGGANPPMVLFVFGRKRVLPVNITSMTITETDFSATLNPIRASVTVTLAVIEGANLPYRYTKAAAEVLSALNLSRVASLQHVALRR
jgi:hypothetical protein